MEKTAEAQVLEDYLLELGSGPLMARAVAVWSSIPDEEKEKSIHYTLNLVQVELRKIAKHWRSNNWYVIDHNSASYKSYRARLGEVLGVTRRGFGSHSAKWPQTRKSWSEINSAGEAIVRRLNNLVTETYDLIHNRKAV